jgi:nuclear transcription factor Y gamma
LEDEEHDYKQHQLPLARIKKVMKADPEVKMISAEAPILFAKGCDIFITELTMRAWIHAEENKRRTLQRSDIAAALTKSDMFDFLIDIVPREEAGASSSKKPPPSGAGASQQPQVPPPAPMPPQQGMQQSGPPHDYGGFVPQEQDYRPPPQMYPPPQSDHAAAYGYPSGPMVDQSMYGYPVCIDSFLEAITMTNIPPDVSNAAPTSSAATAAAERPA